MEESDWAFIPKNLLDMILDKLVSFTDYVRFGAVCIQWKCVARENKLKFLGNKGCIQVPFLMVPSDANGEESLSLYSITRNRICDFQLYVPYKKRLCGSSHGWLFGVEESRGVTLMNPFSSATIELPPIAEDMTLPVPQYAEYEVEFEVIEVEFEVVKATLSVDPALSPNDYIVTAIYGRCCRLALIRAGDEDWTYIGDEKFKTILDVTYYRGHIFVVDYWGVVTRIDVNRSIGESTSPQMEVIVPRTKKFIPCEDCRAYLVESSRGDLLLVRRDYDINEFYEHETIEFTVFKLLLEQCDLVKVHDLGGDILFLGDNHSICVSASKWPGCQPDSIYYTDDCYYYYQRHPLFGRNDMGVFNVKTDSFGTLYYLTLEHSDRPASIWIVPSVLDH